ncbi:hydroxymethylbilane synthase [Candidatus Neoehrlichia procyonis]|uniref:Porphobilinogen deaminase n=1 Tax=Candidatus Neoehrlichia procyonis str. RAC413 TaxID=1359163 RepID=A0A0F3NL80_9RICK|nr:hydroxymethylbilane synthase [Candidatus Neoehrlichia lotoris]KJV68785.1 porphobilinogen deaminase [Candidatus Neoehrlichia lotoris str. RAC413]
MVIRIGTRGSLLAMVQVREVESLLKQRFPKLSIQIVEIKTSGDSIVNVPLHTIGGKALFIKEIEEAMLMKTIDIAVHSTKDVPAFFSNKLIIPCIIKRNTPYDVLISLKYKHIESLPLNATVGTSSIRRKVQLLALRPDLHIVPIRGNIDTRIKKSKEFDAIILAEAGLNRIGKQEFISEVIHPNKMLSAVGQGAICIQCREDDDKIISMIRLLNDHKSYVAIMAERGFMKAVNGSCNTPLAALAQYINCNTLHMKCMLSNGNDMLFLERTFLESDAENVGFEMGLELKSRLFM